MIRINCQFAAVFQSLLAVLLCVSQNADAQAIYLNFMLPASQDVFYDFDRIRAYCHGFPGKVYGIPF